MRLSDLFEYSMPLGKDVNTTGMTFGFEAEFYFDGTPQEFIEDYLPEASIHDSKYTQYYLTDDSSLADGGMELVSPVMKSFTEFASELNRIFAILQGPKFETDSSTGLHGTITSDQVKPCDIPASTTHT